MNKVEIPLEVQNWIGRQLFEHVPSNIAVIDRNFRIVLANSNFKQVFGEPEGRYCYEVYKKRREVCEQCMAARTFEDGKVRVNDEQGVDLQGKPAHYIVHIAPVYNEVGEVTAVIEMSSDVTETKSLQREYNILFERVPCYVAVINRKFQIVRANEMLRNRFGETMGGLCYEVLKHRSERCVDCPAMKTFNDGKMYRSEEIGVDKNGDPAYYVVSTAPLSRSGQDFSHLIEMSIDVTETHRLAGELSRESALRHLLTESSPDALIALDHRGLVSIFNPAAESLLRIPASEVLDQPEGGRFLPPEFHRMVEGGGELTLPEMEIRDSQGDPILVKLHGVVLREGEKTVGSAAYLQDLREVKRLEREKLDSERLATVGQTVAQLAHGIKNILTGLQGGMYIIGTGIEKESYPRIDKGWQILKRNIERITTLVRGFLNYSKKHTPQVQSLEPAELAREVHELYREAAQQKGIALRLEIAGKIAAANLDPQDIHTCLANLVSNAIDACDASEKAEKSVTLRISEEGGSIVFEVTDTGNGMDEATRNKVFTSFFTTKGLNGTGLGLLVTNKLVREHGGCIKVESAENQGASFRIELPRVHLPAAADRPPLKGE